MNLFTEIEKTYPDIEKQFKKRDLAEFKHHNFGMLMDYHFSLGTWIRNNCIYGDTSLAKEFEKVGIDHPDDMSGFIIEMFFIYCNSKNSKF